MRPSLSGKPLIAHLPWLGRNWSRSRSMCACIRTDVDSKLPTRSFAPSKLSGEGASSQDMQRATCALKAHLLLEEERVKRFVVREPVALERPLGRVSFLLLLVVHHHVQVARLLLVRRADPRFGVPAMRRSETVWVLTGSTSTVYGYTASSREFTESVAHCSSSLQQRSTNRI